MKDTSNCGGSIRIVLASEGDGVWASSYVEYILRIVFQDFDDVQIQWSDSERPHLLLRSKNLSPGKTCSFTDVPYICWTGEAYQCRPRSYPPLCFLNSYISDDDDETLDFYAPFGIFRAVDAPPGLRQYKNTNRPNIAGACFSKHESTRIAFFNQLRQRFGNKVKGWGASFNTEGGRRPEGSFNSTELLKNYSTCRFVLAMENTIKPGYITEKIINSFMAGAIPLYWGHADTVKKYFNEKAFVCINDYSSFEECLDDVERIAADDTTWRQMASLDPFASDEARRFFCLDTTHPAAEHMKVVEHLKRTIRPRILEEK